MDQTPIIQLPTPPTEQKKKGKSLLYLELGLFELGFVVVLLGIAFLILNYFNIINLSIYFPSLAFLRRPPIGMQRDRNTSGLSDEIYDSQSSQNDLITFLRQNVQGKWIPKDMTTYTVKSMEQSEQISWSTETSRGLISGAYDFSGKGAILFSFLASINKATSNPISTSSGKLIFNNFFLPNMNGHFICGNTVTKNYCLLRTFTNIGDQVFLGFYTLKAGMPFQNQTFIFGCMYWQKHDTLHSSSCKNVIN